MCRAEVALERRRQEIDRIDREIVALLSRRAWIAVLAGADKRALGLSVADPEREALVLQRIEEANHGPLSNDHVAAIFREIIRVCRTIQE